MKPLSQRSLKITAWRRLSELIATALRRGGLALLLLATAVLSMAEPPPPEVKELFQPSPYLGDLDWRYYAFDRAYRFAVEEQSEQHVLLVPSFLYWQASKGSVQRNCSPWGPWVRLRLGAVVRSRDCASPSEPGSTVEWAEWPYSQPLEQLPELGLEASLLSVEQWRFMAELLEPLGEGLFWLNFRFLLPSTLQVDCDVWTDWVPVRERLWLRSRACRTQAEDQLFEWVEWESRS